jgi:DNA invertase Pin-like site-specific DNA recombinase
MRLVYNAHEQQKAAVVPQMPFVITEESADCDPFMLHIYATFAERERAIIGMRTKNALAALRAIPFSRTALIGETDAPRPTTGEAEPVVLA